MDLQTFVEGLATKRTGSKVRCAEGDHVLRLQPSNAKGSEPSEESQRFDRECAG